MAILAATLVATIEAMLAATLVETLEATLVATPWQPCENSVETLWQPCGNPGGNHVATAWQPVVATNVAALVATPDATAVGNHCGTL